MQQLPNCCQLFIWHEVSRMEHRVSFRVTKNKYQVRKTTYSVTAGFVRLILKVPSEPSC